MNDRVVFARAIYAAEAVDTAVSAYAALADIQIEVNDNEVVAVFDESPPGELVDAFCNHVLYETIVQRRRQVGEGTI